MHDVILENKYITLVISGDCTAKSMCFRQTGEELLAAEERLPLFSVSQERPFNNEVKLAHMNKRTVYPANRLRQEGELLFVGFEEISYEAQIRVSVREKYITFTLESVDTHGCYTTLTMDPPPTDTFCLLQLPLKHRKKFGEWLNVVSDDKVSAAVIATSPYELVDSEWRASCRILRAETRAEIKLTGTTAVLLACPTAEFMGGMEQVEQDFNLPAGVASRRDPRIHISILRVPFLNPDNVDEYIAYAKQGGFRLMLVYYIAMCEEKPGYYFCGNYDYRACYPDREASLKAMLDKVKAAGITPGLHFLHTHIGIESRYVTPVPDHRLRLKKYLTLSRPADKDDTVIYVEEDPRNCTMHPKCRVLRFGKELIFYGRFSGERPWRFEGCKRGYWGTTASDHDTGLIGGLLDISEFGATSIYLEQDSSLQDEIIDKIAAIYNCGFEFAYFDGSEGTNPPYEFHVSNAQYKVFQRFQKPPIFCEGAAKTHFSWHMITGGNAFDAFPDAVFKEKIVEFPFREAAQLQADYTRVNFGWWFFNEKTQPDLYEFGTSRAAAWDCPTTVSIADLALFRNNPRTADVLEVMRRWEDVRSKNWLTEEQKAMLKDPGQEHILLLNETGDYELVPYDRLSCRCAEIVAYSFRRNERNYIVFWHKTGEGRLELQWAREGVLESEPGHGVLPFERKEHTVILPAAGRRYFSSTQSMEKLVTAFENAVCTEI